MSFADIVEIAYYFWHTKHVKLDEFQNTVGHSRPTLTGWLTQCPEVCSISIQIEPKIIGTETKQVQINKRHFSGRRKYGKNRLTKGDISKSRKRKRNEKNYSNEDEICDVQGVEKIIEYPDLRYFEQ